MLFVVFDTIGNIPIFYSLTKDMEERERWRIFTKSLVIASSLLFFFMIFGWGFLAYYGITLDDFRIAGGILLLIIAVQEVLGRVEAQTIESEDIAVVPMATPLWAGPGSIYTVIYLTALYGYLPTLISILLNALVALILLRISDTLLSKVGKNLIMVLSKLMGLILAVIAVSMIRQGVLNLLH